MRKYFVLGAALAATLVSLAWQLARADDGDETLRGYAERSDVIVDATVTEVGPGFNHEAGVLIRPATLRANAVIKGTLDARQPVRVAIVRFESKPEDALPYLTQGARVVLFLNRQREGDAPNLQTADMWFAVQPWSPWIVRSLTRLTRDTSRPTPTLHEARVAWVQQCLSTLQSVRPGMTRGEIMRSFRIDGGIHTPSSARFAHPDCGYFKVDVTFEVRRDPAAQNREIEADTDKAVSVGKPYLQPPFED